jgi:peptidyl-dipeptidase Dcp
LTLEFGDNVLKENNAFELIIENKEDLAGLPESVIAVRHQKLQKIRDIKENGYLH